MADPKHQLTVTDERLHEWRHVLNMRGLCRESGVSYTKAVNRWRRDQGLPPEELQAIEKTLRDLGLL